MKKWNLIIDVAECHGCHNCVVSCKDEYVGNDHGAYAAPQPLHGHRWIEIRSRERGRIPIVDTAHLPVTCNHCDAAPCVAQGRGAVVKRDDGIVVIDPRLSVGRKDLVAACPYGAIWWNEELNIPQAWPFDAHLLDQGWSAPRGVKVCPTEALKVFKATDEEMERRRVEERLETLSPELGTRPRVYYRNLHRYTQCFIGGVVFTQRGGIVDCAADVPVELWRDGSVAQTAGTDPFGEFKFDGLPPDSGLYEVKIAPGTPRARSVPVRVQTDSVVLDPITLGTEPPSAP